MSNLLTSASPPSKSASTYASKPWHRDLINKTHAFLLAHLSWLGVDFLDPSSTFENDSDLATHHHQQKQVRVLDYACGPGTMTAILADHASEFVGVDLSENMVRAYNERFGSTNTNSDPPDSASRPTQTINAHAIVGNLLSPSLTPESSSLLSSSPKYHSFDLAVVGFGFHHFPDLALATERLVARLRPGGVFLIVDFVSHPPVGEARAEPKTKAEAEAEHGHESAGADAHPAQHTIAHHGFGEADVQKYFGGAGLVDVEVLRVPGSVEMVWHGHGKGEGGDGGGEGGGEGHGEGKEHTVSRTIFLGKGRKQLSG